MSPPARPLNIVHVFRAPLGGLFRHVVDLTKGQHARGPSRRHCLRHPHRRRTRREGPRRIDAPSRARPVANANAAPRLLARPHGAARTCHAGSTTLKADVVHGHGAKGGAYARFALARRGAIRVYTPHGGSLNYDHTTAVGKFYLAIERLLMQRGDVYTFESAYSADVYRDKIGTPRGIVRVVHNGVSKAEFEPVDSAGDATDLVFLGEFRPAKGINTLFDALILLLKGGRRVSVTLVGDGPDMPAMRAQIARDDLAASIRIFSPMPAREALALGRIMVVPSHAESLPYVVLEAAAAGKPLIVTRVGGLPEIYGPLSDNLVPARDAAALAAAIARTLDDCPAAERLAAELRERVSQRLFAQIDGGRRPRRLSRPVWLSNSATARR